MGQSGGCGYIGAERHLAGETAGPVAGWGSCHQNQKTLCRYGHLMQWAFLISPLRTVERLRVEAAMSVAYTLQSYFTIRNACGGLTCGLSACRHRRSAGLWQEDCHKMGRHQAGAHGTTCSDNPFPAVTGYTHAQISQMEIRSFS